MFLEKLAQEIANMTSEVIAHDVLITDQQGIVVGSSDLDRVGTLHQASLDSIQSKLPGIHNEQVSKNMVGVKPGMTIPIEFSNEIIGTIGITGEPEKVKKYGLLVKKHAEILLREEALNRSVVLREKVLQSLLQDICAIHPEANIDERFFKVRAKELGYELELQRRIIVVDFSIFDKFKSTENLYANCTNQMYANSILMEFESRMENLFTYKQDIHLFIDGTRYLILKEVRQNSRSNTFNDKQILNDLYKVVSSFNKHAKIVVGPIAQDIKSLNHGINDTMTMLNLVKHQKKDINVYNYANHRLDILFAHIPNYQKERYIESVLSIFPTDNQRLTMLNTVKKWFESGFKSKECAADLNIHRNTLLYRIQRIEETTGKNMHNFQDVLDLYISIRMSEDSTISDF